MDGSTILASSVGAPCSSRPSTCVQPGARFSKLMKGCDKLVSGAVRDFLDYDLQKSFGPALPKGSDQWLRLAQTVAAARLAEEMERQQTDALLQHQAAKRARNLDDLHYGSGQVELKRAAINRTVPPSNKEPEKEIERRLRLHVQAAKLTMLRERFRDQQLENQAQAAENARMQAEIEDLLGMLDSKTCNMIAPLLRNGGHGGA